MNLYMLRGLNERLGLPVRSRRQNAYVESALQEPGKEAAKAMYDGKHIRSGSGFPQIRYTLAEYRRRQSCSGGLISAPETSPALMICTKCPVSSWSRSR